jgi:hypothetical protein
MAKAAPPPKGRHVDSKGRVVSPNIISPDDALQPIAEVMPNASQMRRMSKGQLWRRLRQHKIFRPWDDYVEGQAQYLERMTKLRPGSEQFEDELNGITDLSSRKNLRMMTKTVSRRFNTAEAIGGDLDQLLIRVTDTEIVNGQPTTCGPCFELAGATGNYAFHVGIGLPGVDSCDGGDECNCELVPIEID